MKNKSPLFSILFSKLPKCRVGSGLSINIGGIDNFMCET